MEDDTIQAPITISWIERKAGASVSKVSFKTIVSLKWSDVLQHLPLKEGVARNRVTLSKMFANAVAADYRKSIEKEGQGTVGWLRGRFEPVVFDHILQRLEREGIVSSVEGPKYVKQRSPYWLLTAEGAKRVTEATR